MFKAMGFHVIHADISKNKTKKSSKHIFRYIYLCKNKALSLVLTVGMFPV